MTKIDNLLNSILDLIEAAENREELADATGTIYKWIREHRESTGKEPIKGIRVFDCPGCGHSWEEGSRDMHSPSGDECPECEEWVSAVPKREGQQCDCEGHQRMWNFKTKRFEECPYCTKCNGTGHEDG